MTIANLVEVDSENRFEALFDRYYEPITGTVMVTAANIVGSSAKITVAKPALKERIVQEILKVENTKYKMHGELSLEGTCVACGQALSTLGEIVNRGYNKQPVVEFIKRQCDSPRPAVRKKAEQLLKTHRIAR
ncbi:hypothetical protein ES703_53575 [subsurface metagenome]